MAGTLSKSAGRKTLVSLRRLLVAGLVAILTVGVRAQDASRPDEPVHSPAQEVAGAEFALAPSEEPEEVATGFTPRALARNDSHLFVAIGGHNPETCGLNPALTTPILQRMDFDGSNAQTLMEGCFFAPRGLVVDATHVIFRDSDNTIKRIPVGGGGVQDLVHDTCCGGLVLDDTHLYWGQWGEAGQDDAILRIPKGGGAAETVASYANPENHNIRQLALDDSYVYWVEGAVGNEALDEPGEGSVKRVPKAGGAIDVLADTGDGIDNAFGITVDDTHVFWSESGSGRVRRVAKGGGSVTNYVDAQEDYMGGYVAVNDTDVFWTDTTGGYDGRLRRVDIGGGTAEDLALGVLGPSSVLLTDSHVYWSQFGGVFRLPIGAGAIAVDLAVEWIEITQAIQNLANDVNLVAGKPAFVRVYPRLVETHGSLPGLAVEAQLRGYRGGQELPGSPLNSVNDTVYVTPVGPSRMKLEDTFNFWLPEDWRSGNVTLQAEIDPHGDVHEFNLNNNVLSVTRTFHDKKPLCVEMVSVRTDPQTATASDPGFVDIVDWLRVAFPVPKVLIDIGGTIEETQVCFFGPIPYPCGGPYEIPSDANKVVARLGWYDLWHSHNAWEQCGKAHFFGMIHPSETASGGLGRRPGHQAWGVMNVDPTFGGFDKEFSWYLPHGGSTLAHELGHNNGRKHVDCGGPDGTDKDYPYNPCNIGPGFPGTEFGFDYLDDAVINPFEAADLMSYGPSAGKPRWPSSYTYEAIFDKINDAAAQSAAMPGSPQLGSLAKAVLEADEVLAIAGVITPTAGTGTLEGGYRLPDGLVADEKLAKLSESVEPGPVVTYSLRLLDASDGILLEQGFQPPVTEDVTGEQDTFLMLTDYMTDTAHVALYAGETELARKEVSPSSPEVTVLEPNGGESYAGTFTVTWQAEDQDGDDLLYTIQYSPDDGTTWQVMATEHYTTFLAVEDSGHLPGSGDALVRVIATDGINTGIDTSDRVFSLRPHPPTVKISKPKEGDILGFGDLVTLVGSGWDAEDGTLEGTALDWEIDGQPAGSGEDATTSGLTIGPHTVTLRGTDSDGMTDEDEVQIHVRRQACADNDNRLDIVFVLDAAGDMSTFVDPICSVLPGVTEDLREMGLEVRQQVFGMTAAGPVSTLRAQQSCITQTVDEIDPGTAVNHPSDWGEAIVSVAEHYDWLEDYSRLIVPVSNQGPENGDPVEDPGSDREVIATAAAAAKANGVSVLPLVVPAADGLPDPKLRKLANDLAVATAAGAVMEWADNDLDIAETIEGNQARLGCRPQVFSIWPGGVVTGTTDLLITGRHLCAGTHIFVGGLPASGLSPSPDCTTLGFRLPPGLPPEATYDLRVERPGAGQDVAEGGILFFDSWNVYLPLVERRAMRW